MKLLICFLIALVSACAVEESPDLVDVEQALCPFDIGDCWECGPGHLVLFCYDESCYWSCVVGVTTEEER